MLVNNPTNRRFYDCCKTKDVVPLKALRDFVEYYALASAPRNDDSFFHSSVSLSPKGRECSFYDNLLSFQDNILSFPYLIR